MAATDAVAFTNAWAARARELGATVDFETGWDTRGNGSAASYEGGIVHHTATPSSEAKPYPTRDVLINGRTGLPGPLCNVAGPWCPPEAPRLIVVSARPANHAGASGGRSMGPLPVTGSFNSRVFGLEIDYSGLVPMAPGQYRAALIFARAVADVLGRSLEYVRAHAETSVTGKWDPGYANGKTIDMAAFRRDAANLTTAAPEDDVSMANDPDLRGSIHEIIGLLRAIHPAVASIQTGMIDPSTGIRAMVLQLAGRDPVEVDEDELAAALAPRLGDVLRPGTPVSGSISDIDLSRIAQFVADEQARRQAA